MKRNYCLTITITLLVITLSGCSGPFKFKETSSINLFRQRNQNSLNSSKSSTETQQFLRLSMLDKQEKKDRPSVIKHLKESSEKVFDLQTQKAIAELALLEGRATHNKDIRYSAGMYLTSAEAAYRYIFAQHQSDFGDTLNPSYRFMAEIYKAAVSQAFELATQLRQKGEILGPAISTDDTVYTLIKMPPTAYSLDPEVLDYVYSSNMIQTFGVENHYFSYGFGVPLIGIVNNPRQKIQWGQYYPIKKAAYPITCVAEFSQPVVKDNIRQVDCSLTLYDPLASDKIEIENRKVELEADFTSPLVLQVDNTHPLLMGIQGLLNSDKLINNAGIIMLEPYRDEKIPVVLVHGLVSTPITWVPIFNDLRGDPQLRNKYQFWFFAYPSGLPIIYSASILRQNLIDIRKKYDPENKNKNFDQMVLVGHSMGGLLSRLMIQDSGDIYWNAVFADKFEDVDIDDNTKQFLHNMLYFKKQDNIKRVIFLSTPHKGSDLADQWYSKFASGIISLPDNLNDAAANVLSQADIKVKDDKIKKTKKMRRSIELLSPSSPFMQTLQTVPISDKVICHSIIGIQNSKTAEGSTDGVVRYESSHIDWAVSEKLVNSSHNSHKNPAAIAEVKRILKLHYEQIKN